MFTILPAVDVSEGKSVRLQSGKIDKKTYCDDALAAAEDWVLAGAQWLHLVDLDAAFGKGLNREVLTRIITKLDVKVELSGGISDAESLQWALSTGAARVNLSSAALADLPWVVAAVAQYGERIAVCLDVWGSRLFARGVGEIAGDLWGILAQLEAAGCARYVVTDVTKDGKLSGVNTDLLCQVAAHVQAPIVASGGIATLADVATLISLKKYGIDSAIIGKALYAANFTLEQALAMAAADK